MIDKLIKLLNLSQSDNDHEALAAIRKVNKMLSDNDKSWEDIVKGKLPDLQKSAPSFSDIFKEAGRRQSADFNRAFSTARASSNQAENFRQYYKDKQAGSDPFRNFRN